MLVGVLTVEVIYPASGVGRVDVRTRTGKVRVVEQIEELGAHRELGGLQLAESQSSSILPRSVSVYAGAVVWLRSCCPKAVGVV